MEDIMNPIRYDIKGELRRFERELCYVPTNIQSELKSIHASYYRTK